MRKTVKQKDSDQSQGGSKHNKNSTPITYTDASQSALGLNTTGSKS